jgi:hypothetical protein
MQGLAGQGYGAINMLKRQLKPDGGWEKCTGVPMKSEVFMGCFRFLGKNACVATRR